MGPTCRNGIGVSHFERGISNTYMMMKSTLMQEISMLHLRGGLFSAQCRSRIRHVAQRGD